MHDALHLLVGVQREVAGELLHVADGSVVKHLAPFRFVEQTLIHPAAQDV